MSIKDELKAQIAEAISKSLPQQVGDALRSELEELAQLRHDNNALDGKIANLNVLLGSKVNQLAAAQAELSAHASVAARVAAVQARENKMDLMDLQVKMADARREDVLGVVSMVFKSPVYRHQMMGTVPVPVEGSPGGNGGYPTAGTVLSMPVSTTTATTID